MDAAPALDCIPNQALRKWNRLVVIAWARILLFALHRNKTARSYQNFRNSGKT
jgi:hypothetical protein